VHTLKGSGRGNEEENKGELRKSEKQTLIERRRTVKKIWSRARQETGKEGENRVLKTG